ncbi:putative lipid II flippase FtsW [Methylococcaceae bacterium CS1]|nr:putative lipid II flippase FtsW [Methyloprofundus sp.]TXK96154.1 putative lipid II flippase FtsW [Methylococcaceae bacterium CS4]TXK97764.1 putative lipid II flippase FtsW [Methylococcaceae bacterium CS5]TXL05796.1 putative lipid II flippase FtsW [Methylococcaceae bacterium CS1]TXL08146.1 putative lipid II flippase FtsW [Methylococcaceae bacterium CS3]TXL10279.1 putative lipid II flippase FtsW [Methylococcaceae bacterium CS2]
MNLSVELTRLAGVDIYFDKALVFASVALIVIGYLMVSSASLHLGVKLTGNLFHYPVRQLIHIGLGVGIGFGVCLVPMAIWEKTGPVLFVVGLIFLVLVLIPGLGIKVNGSMRWLSIAGVRIQVSELVKLIVVIYMASFVTRHHDFVKESAYGLVRPLLLLSGACALLLLEPDMGSAVVILTIAMGVMFLSGARLQQFIILIIAVVGFGILAVVFSDYRSARVAGFLHPWEDPFGKSFQLVQALISFGRGEWTGVGLGSGVQKLFYLPEAHTDFLFSVIAEELGLLGVLSVIALFAIIVWRAFAIGLMAEQLGEKFSAYIAYGLGIWFAFQSFVNMGVNMGALPTKGLTLPFMSYGGGCMIVMCSAMAMLYRVNSEMMVLQRA